MNQDQLRAALRPAHYGLLHLLVKDFRAGYAYYGEPDTMRRKQLDELASAGYADLVGLVFYPSVAGELALATYTGSLIEDNSAKIVELEKKRLSLQKEIYQVVAKLGCKDNTQDAQYQLEYELLILQKADTNAAADWVHYKQLDDLLGRG